MIRRVSLVCAAGVLFASVLAGVSTAGSRAAVAPAWHTNPRGNLDCNGWSPVQKLYRQLSCVEVTGNEPDGLFEDNGHYVGHDEPALEYFSKRARSGYSQQYQVTLPTDPASPPHDGGHTPVWNFMIHIAPWFGLVMCDDQSYPEGSPNCTPNSDSNIQVPPRADHAGTAYTELQFYPPGDTNVSSCDATHWCVALTITSLQASFGFAKQNNNCIEPQAFAFLTKDGKPTGPPGPDNVTRQTFTVSANTFLMNPGDDLTVQLYDTADGLRSAVIDHTTGESGSMVASQANGWRHILWDPVNFTCKAAPYTFHPMYATAAPPTPTGEPRAWAIWTAHTYNVAYTDEIGHFEPRDGDGDDRFCSNGPPISGCADSDVDFDGWSYRHNWPDGTKNHPGALYVHSPTSADSSGNFTKTFSLIRFEADLPRIEAPDFGGTCDRNTGRGCVNPPRGAKFYPWFHLVNVGGSCAWALSDDLPKTINDFGGEQAEYGPLLHLDYGFIMRYNDFASGRISNSCP